MEQNPMQIIDVVQGSDEWLKMRLLHCCASEAPAMMGVSPYMSRNQLLDAKKGWLQNPVDFFKQMLFDKGHEYEKAARSILELDECEDFPPVVGMLHVDGVDLWASFDGLAGDSVYRPMEHKGWNGILSENVRNGVLEPLYYWQLEQQCIVSGSDTILFICSDGTEENKATMYYTSHPERRKELIDGWKQFLIDLESHKLEAKQEKIEAEKVEHFIVPTFKIEGTNIVSNIDALLMKVKDRAKVEKERKLETDQDFVDKKDLNKAIKATRSKLKDLSATALSNFDSFQKFTGTISQIDKILQVMVSEGEKQVKEEEANRKHEIKNAGEIDINDFMQGQNAIIAPMNLCHIVPDICADFNGAIKGKSKPSIIKSCVDGEVARVKIDINNVMAKVVPNQKYLREHATDFPWLFKDSQSIVNQDAEPFQAIVSTRIREYKDSEIARVLREAETKRLKDIEDAKEKIVDQSSGATKNNVPDNPAPVPIPAKTAQSSIVTSDKPAPETVAQSCQGSINEDLEPSPAQNLIDDLIGWGTIHEISEPAMNDLESIIKNHFPVE